MGGAGFPTYVKYDTKKKIKTLIVNAVECEPFISVDYEIVKLKCEEILETIDAILEINKIEQAIIAIKKDNAELKEIFDNYIGTYLKINIKLVDNVYPMGWERRLVLELTGKNYNLLPIEKGIVVNNISTIYAIYESLKFNKPLIEKMITISGDKVNKKCNMMVKIVTPIKELLEKVDKQDNYIIISGGPMMGKEVDDDAIISNNQNCLLLMEEKRYNVNPCIKCGKCVSVCPVKLSPVLIMNCRSKKKLPDLRPELCIECGLCSYICPSKINVRNCVKEKQQMLKGEK